jgi:iron complex outermembrane recepter protein
MTRGQMFDVQRVEVLKGPQGDLYGRNTTGGAVNFVSNKPTEEFEAGVKLEYGRWDSLGLDAYISGPLSDSVKGRIALTSTNSGDGWFESHTRSDELGEVATLGVRALLDFDVSESANILVNVHYNSNESENAGQARSGLAGPTQDLFCGVPLGQESGWLALPLAASCFPGDTGIPVADALAPAAPEDLNTGDWNTGFRPVNDNELFGTSVTINWDFDAATLTSISAYDKFERLDSFDWDGTALSLFEQVSDTEITSFSQELRLTSTGDGAVNWIAGLYYSDDEIDDIYRASVGEASGSNGIFADVDQTTIQNTTTSAVFGHVEWQFDESWRLTLGGRFTSEDRDVGACSRDADGGLAFLFNDLDLIDFDLGGTGDDFFLSSTALATGDCVTIDPDRGSVIVDGNGPGTLIIFGGESDLFVDEITTDNFSGKVGLDYLPNDDWLLYASVGTGFKSGGYNGALASSFFQLEPYKEEELTTVELGFKATLADGSMQLNAAAFYYDYQDKQVISIINDPVFGPLAALVNVPESEILGAEIEGSWLPSDALSINFGLAYLDTEVKKYEGFHPLQPGVGLVDFKGAELGSAPQLTANLRASYEWTLGNDRYVRLGGDLSYRDDYHAGLQYVNPTDVRFDVESYTLINARLALGAQDTRWEVAAWVRNLADEYYYHSASFSNDAITRGVGQGRNYGVAFSYNWN